MPRLYREAPLASIWEGSGNVMSLDVLRALARTPRSLEVFLHEVEQAAGADARLDARVRSSRASSPTPPRSRRARAGSSKAWRCACRARCSCATPRRPSPTRSAPRASAGDGGLEYGTLPAGTDFEAIIARSRPQRLATRRPRRHADARDGASLAPTIEPMRRASQLPARAHLRHPHRRQRELVLRAVLPHLLPLATTSTKCSAARSTTAYAGRRRGRLGYFASLILHELGHALAAAAARDRDRRDRPVVLRRHLADAPRAADARARSSRSPRPGRR